MNEEEKEYVMKTTPNNFKKSKLRTNNFDVRLLKSNSRMNQTNRNKDTQLGGLNTDLKIVVSEFKTRKVDKS